MAQVVPPRRGEGILGAIGSGVLGMILVVVDHAAETGIAQGADVGIDAFVGGSLVAEEPPRLHAIVRCGIAPQRMQGRVGPRRRRCGDERHEAGDETEDCAAIHC